MKTFRGLLVLDFSIQAVLIGGMISTALICSIFKTGELIEFLWVPYFILGGWQLFCAILLRYLFNFRGIDGYLKANYIFFLTLAGIFGAGYLGILTNSVLAGFFWLFILLLSFIPPILAIYRFIESYIVLDNQVEDHEKTLVPQS